MMINAGQECRIKLDDGTRLRGLVTNVQFDVDGHGPAWTLTIEMTGKPKPPKTARPAPGPCPSSVPSLMGGPSLHQCELTAGHMGDHVAGGARWWGIA